MAGSGGHAIAPSHPLHDHLAGRTARLTMPHVMVKAALATLVVGGIDQAESCALREVACGIRPSHSGQGDSQGAACKQRGQCGDRPTKG